MAQYNSRVCIEVVDPSVFKKLLKLDTAKYGLLSAKELFGCLDVSKCILDDFSLNEDLLLQLVTEIGKILKTSGVVIGDTTNWNADPFTYVVFYLGDQVEEFLFEFGNKRCELQDQVCIDDILKWFSVVDVGVTAKEKKQLQKLGYAVKLKARKAQKPIEYDIMFGISLPDKSIWQKVFSQVSFYKDQYTIFDCISQPENLKADETFCYLQEHFFYDCTKDGYAAVVLYFNDLEEKEISKIMVKIVSALAGNGAVVAYGEARKQIIIAYELGNGSKLIHPEWNEDEDDYLISGSCFCGSMDEYRHFVELLLKKNSDALTQTEIGTLQKLGLSSH